MPLRVLVYDDDLVSRPDFLGELPAELIYRGHADDAIDEVRELAPDLVLMDYSMGRHRNGLDSVVALRRVFSPAELTIIGISSDAVLNERMVRAGADAGFVKFSAPRRLRVWLDRPSARPRGPSPR